MTKDELIASIRRDRATLDALVASLDEAQMTTPALDGGWSVKDVLAHISAWEELCASWLDAAGRGETPDRPEVRNVDETNARVYAAAKDTPLALVLARSRTSYEAMLRAVEALSDADLADEQRFGWPAWQMASGNSDEHYREHAAQIARWLSEVQP